MWNTDKQEELFAWLRYLYWADLARHEWDQFAESERNADEWIVDWWGFFARMSHFYAAEYVVIEGWHEAGFTDSVIDEAMNRWPDLIDLLRRYRNGVFHYQPKVVEPRFIGFLNESESSWCLVHYLHSEFCRFYWNYLETFPGSHEQRSEFRESILKVVGWVPDDLIEAEASRLRQLADEAEVLTQSDDSLQAKDLRDTATDTRIIADRQVIRYREMCRAFLSRKTTG